MCLNRYLQLRGPFLDEMRRWCIYWFFLLRWLTPVVTGESPYLPHFILLLTRGFPKWGIPKPLVSIPRWSKMIWGYPHFRKPPNGVNSATDDSWDEPNHCCHPPARPSRSVSPLPAGTMERVRVVGALNVQLGLAGEISPWGAHIMAHILTSGVKMPWLSIKDIKVTSSAPNTDPVSPSVLDFGGLSPSGTIRTHRFNLGYYLCIFM